MEKCIHAIVTGRVQGVFFRDSTQKEANRLSVQGWVKNNPDGTVELLAKGLESNMDTFIEWLGHGPKAARVDDLTIDVKSTSECDYSTFDITG
jgi:acylphosphatase